MTLRLGNAVRARDAEARQVLAQTSERPLVQEAGEIVGRVGQKLAASDADEKVEVFTLEVRSVRIFCGFGQFAVGSAERRFIAVQLPDLLQQHRIGRACEQSPKQRIFRCTRTIDVVDAVFVVEIRPQNRTSDSGRALQFENAATQPIVQ